MKLCKDCKHFQDGRCFRPSVAIPDPVYGSPTGRLAEYTRDKRSGECGPDGRLFDESSFRSFLNWIKSL